MASSNCGRHKAAEHLPSQLLVVSANVTAIDRQQSAQMRSVTLPLERPLQNWLPSVGFGLPTTVAAKI